MGADRRPLRHERTAGATLAKDHAESLSGLGGSPPTRVGTVAGAHVRALLGLAVYAHDIALHRGLSLLFVADNGNASVSAMRAVSSLTGSLVGTLKALGFVGDPGLERFKAELGVAARAARRRRGCRRAGGGGARGARPRAGRAVRARLRPEPGGGLVVRRRAAFLDSGPSMREVVQGEHRVRHLRAEVAEHGAGTSRVRLVRALAEQLLSPGPGTAAFLDRLDAWLDGESLDADVLDRLIAHLSLNHDPKGAA